MLRNCATEPEFFRPFRDQEKNSVSPRAFFLYDSCGSICLGWGERVIGNNDRCSLQTYDY